MPVEFEKEDLCKYESVAVSTRMRLARNFRDYPFPHLMLREENGQEQAQDMVRILNSELNRLDAFRLYDMKTASDDVISYLKERNIISRDLIKNRLISAALVSKDEEISVMVNEEDHLRIQYFTRGFRLAHAFERVMGIDDLISGTIPLAFDRQFGYLTACPTNLGTGMRASAMLFLPAMSRRGVMKTILREISRGGLAVRGASGEGSTNEGDLFQVSNETTLGLSEEDILLIVDRAVDKVTDIELRERKRMLVEGGLALSDELSRSYGILVNCRKISAPEFLKRISDLKLGLALGIFHGKEKAETLMSDLDDLAVAIRPANINKLNGFPLEGEEAEAFRAKYAVRKIRDFEIITD